MYDEVGMHPRRPLGVCEHFGGFFGLLLFADLY